MPYFFRFTETIAKPSEPGYPIAPKTLGEHIKKVRMDKGLLQKDAAASIGVSEDSITNWENERYVPQVRYYPAIISFLGYYPFLHETETIGGKLKQVLFCNGWSHAQCAEALGIDSGTVKRILNGQRTFNGKSNNIIPLWSQIPHNLKQQYRP